MSLQAPSSYLTELVAITVLMLLVALFAPLYGLLLALLVLWHAQQNSLKTRRNVAGLCAGLAIFNLVFPTVLLPHL